MLGSYRAVLRAPGGLAFSGAGLIARLPMSTYGLGFVLLVAARTGRYGLAGTVAAAYGLAASASSPFLARAVDRLGQARVLRPVVSVNALAVVGLVAAVERGLPAWVVLALAVAVGGASPSVGSLVRARWQRALIGSDLLTTAFALESVVDEFLFVVGPPVVTLVATQLDAAIAPLGIAALSAGGGWWLASQHGTEPPIGPSEHRGGASALASPAMQVLVPVFFAAGGIFGSVEVVAVAFTAERGVPGAAGLVLGAFALGSMLAGLAYGARAWAGPAAGRFVMASSLLGFGTVPLALVNDVRLLGVALFLAGLAISPMVVAGFGLVEAVAPPGRLTECLSWCTTAITLGAAVGAAVAGPTVDAAGGHRAFLVAVGSGALAVGTAVLGRRRVGSRASVDLRLR